MFRMLNRRDSTLWRSLVSHEKAADEISATGGPRRLSPHGGCHRFEPTVPKPRKNRSMKDLFFLGGISRTRTYDPHDVNVVL